MKLNIYLTAIVTTFILGCGTTNPEPPERPEKVPEDAKWYGGKDGGVWITVAPTDEINHFIIGVFIEHNGELWTKGKFMINQECFSEKYTAEEIRKSIDSWSGKTINLGEMGNNGRFCALIPVKDE